MNKIIFLTIALFCSAAVIARPTTGRAPATVIPGPAPAITSTPIPTTPTPAPADNDLTISYSIAITSKKANTGIAETYNGGMATVFATKAQARLRLVSLMRIQSIFISMNKGKVQQVTLVKESGNGKHKTSLTPEEWRAYNKKYDGAICKLTPDTAMILKRLCKKAIISLKDGRQLTAYYTTTIQNPVYSSLEPAFAAIPGLVLKYEYTYKKKTITYTATAISQNPISADIFATPPK
jgi:GLPGLI family protein